MKMVPRVREIFDRYGVSGEAGEEILAAAFQEASHRARSPEEVAARTLRALERRAAAWRRTQDEASAEAADAADEGDGESAR